MTFREEFEKAFDEEVHLGFSTQMITALWAAKWMAERCANIVLKLAPGCDDVSDEIRQLAKELEDKP